MRGLTYIHKSQIRVRVYSPLLTVTLLAALASCAALPGGEGDSTPAEEPASPTEALSADERRRETEKLREMAESQYETTAERDSPTNVEVTQRREASRTGITLRETLAAPADEHLPLPSPPRPTLTRPDPPRAPEPDGADVPGFPPLPEVPDIADDVDAQAAPDSADDADDGDAQAVPDSAEHGDILPVPDSPGDKEAPAVPDIVEDVEDGDASGVSDVAEDAEDRGDAVGPSGVAEAQGLYSISVPLREWSRDGESDGLIVADTRADLAVPTRPSETVEARERALEDTLSSATSGQRAMEPPDRFAPLEQGPDTLIAEEGVARDPLRAPLRDRQPQELPSEQDSDWEGIVDPDSADAPPPQEEKPRAGDSTADSDEDHDDEPRRFPVQPDIEEQPQSVDGAKAAVADPERAAPPAPSDTGEGDREPVKEVTSEADGTVVVELEGRGWVFTGDGSDDIELQDRSTGTDGVRFVFRMRSDEAAEARFQREDLTEGEREVKVVLVSPDSPEMPEEEAEAASASEDESQDERTTGDDEHREAFGLTSEAADDVTQLTDAELFDKLEQSHLSPERAVAVVDELSARKADIPAEFAVDSVQEIANGHAEGGAAEEAIRLLEFVAKHEPDAELHMTLARLYEEVETVRNLRLSLKHYETVHDDFPRSPHRDDAGARARLIRRNFFDLR